MVHGKIADVEYRSDKTADVKISEPTMSAERRLCAITIYCEGVKEDFPDAGVWMDNIIALAKE